MRIIASAPHRLIVRVLLVTGSAECLTFPAALGLAPLSRSSSATSTFPYLEATCSGVKPFCSNRRHIYSVLDSDKDARMTVDQLQL